MYNTRKRQIFNTRRRVGERERLVFKESETDLPCP